MNRFAVIALLLICTSAGLFGETTIRVAVASNFHHTLETIARSYESANPQTKVLITPGSSGKLYAQIVNGALYDAFFSADIERAQKLETDGRAEVGTRFTYAIGILAFWQPRSPKVEFANVKTLAIANPDTAPYGRAAEEAIRALEISADRVATSSSVSQALSFVKSGAADSGLVSCAQLQQLGIDRGEFKIIDSGAYTPIEQQAVALNNKDSTKQFLEFCRSKAIRTTIAEAGYRIP